MVGSGSLKWGVLVCGSEWLSALGCSVVLSGSICGAWLVLGCSVALGVLFVVLRKQGFSMEDLRRKLLRLRPKNHRSININYLMNEDSSRAGKIN